MGEEKKPTNSSMAPNLEEMKDHGKVMEQLETNTEVKQKGKEPDPKQR